MLKAPIQTYWIILATVLLQSKLSLTAVKLRDCKDIQMTYLSHGSGLYTLDLSRSNTSVRCDMRTDGGGWTVSTCIITDLPHSFHVRNSSLVDTRFRLKSNVITNCSGHTRTNDARTTALERSVVKATAGCFLIVLGFNDTSTLEGHFVSSPREREKR